jgi:hypothetical protein
VTGFLCFTSVSPVKCWTKTDHATPLLSVPHFIRHSLSSHQMTCATENLVKETNTGLDKPRSD